MAKDTVKCQYCGEEFSPRGIKSHEKACEKNPKNKNLVTVNSPKKENLEDKDVLVIDAKEGEVELENEGEVTIISPKLEEKIKMQLNDEVALVKNEKKPYEPKNVKIVLKKYHRCNIGGNWYEFFPDKQYIVPDNVKEILMKVDLLKPL